MKSGGLGVSFMEPYTSVELNSDLEPYTSVELNRDLEIDVQLAYDSLHKHYYCYVTKIIREYLLSRAYDPHLYLDDLRDKAWDAIFDHVNKVANGQIERKYQAVPPFIMKVTYTVCLGYFHRARQNRITRAKQIDEECHQIPDKRYKSHEKIFEDKQQLRQIFAKLNAEERGLILLDGLGYSCLEIGSLKGLTAGAVRVKLFRIKQKINKSSNNK